MQARRSRDDSLLCNAKLNGSILKSIYATCSLHIGRTSDNLIQELLQWNVAPHPRRDEQVLPPESLVSLYDTYVLDCGAQSSPRTEQRPCAQIGDRGDEIISCRADACNGGHERCVCSSQMDAEKIHVVIERQLFELLTNQHIHRTHSGDRPEPEETDSFAARQDAELTALPGPDGFKQYRQTLMARKEVNGLNARLSPSDQIRGRQKAQLILLIYKGTPSETEG